MINLEGLRYFQYSGASELPYENFTMINLSLQMLYLSTVRYYIKTNASFPHFLKTTHIFATRAFEVNSVFGLICEERVIFS